MKTLTCLLLLAPTILFAQAKQVLPMDAKASTLAWTGHAEVGSYAPSGGLAVREGQVMLENGSFAGAVLVVDMNSMSQSNADLLHHLKSADFFDVEHYPTAVIRIDRVADGKVYGTMTVKGKTEPLEAPVRVTESNDRFTIAGKATLDRTQYGIVYNSSSVFSGLGNKAIRNTFEVEFSLVGLGKLPEKYRM